MKRGIGNTGAYEHHLQGGFDPHWAFVSLMPRFVDLARDAAAVQAVSHRDFRVGAALYAGDATFSTVATLDGANVKPTPNDPKYCAEMSVIDQAQALGLSKVLGLVVAGTSDPEKIKSVAGVATPTLRPCDACQAKMTDSGLFEESSLIVTISTEEDKYEVHTYGELLQAGRTSAEDAMEVTYDPDLWHWRQAAYGRNLAEVPDSQPWHVAKLALETTVGAVA